MSVKRTGTVPVGRSGIGSPLRGCASLAGESTRREERHLGPNVPPDDKITRYDRILPFEQERAAPGRTG
jgi:hypothetical protein